MKTWVKFGKMENEAENRFWFVVEENCPDCKWDWLCDEELTSADMENLMVMYRTMTRLRREKEKNAAT